MSAQKTQPLGVCDLCRGAILRDEWYTCQGKPRLHCSRECRNTANSRAGNPIRVEKLKLAVARGEWKNPLLLLSPEQLRDHQSRAATTSRNNEVAAGRWRNPALDDAAREKLSRPRTVTDPKVHRAIEMMNQGIKLSELPQELRAAYNAYSREYERTHHDEIRAKQRAAYRRRQAQMTDAAREQQRAKWRAENHSRAARGYRRPR